MSIKINIKIFACILIFYLTKQIEIYAMFMIFAIVHEMAHLICGIVMGLKPKTLKIMPVGVCIEFGTRLADYNNKVKKSNQLAIKKIIIAIAGPLINFIIAVFLLIFKPTINNVNIENIIYCNILIAIFNMLPIYPLDGGRILKNIFKIYLGKRQAIEIIHLISNLSVIFVTAIASIAIYCYENIAILFIIAFLWVMLIKENREYKLISNAYKVLEWKNGD